MNRRRPCRFRALSLRAVGGRAGVVRRRCHHKVRRAYRDRSTCCGEARDRRIPHRDRLASRLLQCGVKGSCSRRERGTARQRRSWVCAGKEDRPRITSRDIAGKVVCRDRDAYGGSRCRYRGRTYPEIRNRTRLNCCCRCSGDGGRYRIRCRDACTPAVFSTKFSLTTPATKVTLPRFTNPGSLLVRAAVPV